MGETADNTDCVNVPEFEFVSLKTEPLEPDAAQKASLISPDMDTSKCNSTIIKEEPTEERCHDQSVEQIFVEVFDAQRSPSIASVSVNKQTDNICLNMDSKEFSTSGGREKTGIIYNLVARKYKCGYCSYENSDKFNADKHFRESHLGEEKVFSCNYCSFRTHLKVTLTHHIRIIHSKGRRIQDHKWSCQRGIRRVLKKKIINGINIRQGEFYHETNTSTGLEQPLARPIRFRLWNFNQGEQSSRNKEKKVGAECSGKDDQSKIVDSESGSCREKDDELKTEDPKSSQVEKSDELKTVDPKCSKCEKDDKIKTVDPKSSKCEKDDKIKTVDPKSFRCEKDDKLKVVDPKGSKCRKKDNTLKITDPKSAKRCRKKEKCNSDEAQIKEKDFRCPECDYKTINKWQLNLHAKVHSEVKDYRCNLCCFETNYKSTLMTHIKAIHLRKKDFKCSRCDYETSYRSTLNKHMRNIHLKIRKEKKEGCNLKLSADADEIRIKRNFKCSKCSYESVSRWQLTQHTKKVHIKKDLLCDQCSFVTNLKSTLRTHIEAIHLKTKDFKCNLCDHESSYNSALNKHVQTVHFKIKAHKCSRCGFEASRKSTLKLHIQAIHIKLNDFKCHLCEREYSTKSSLHNHIKNSHVRQIMRWIADRSENIYRGFVNTKLKGT